MNDSREEEIREIASTELACPMDQLAYSYAGGHVHRETGCGKNAEFVLLCAGFCFPASLQELRKRAGFELGCQEPLTIVELNEKTYGVEGCGRRATYLLAMVNSGPQWLMDSTTTPAPAPAAAPAAAPAPAPAAAPAPAPAPAP